VSSLVYLGLSLVLFVITYGVAFTIMPMIFGAFFNVADISGLLDPTACDTSPTSAACQWGTIYENNEDTVQYLVPLMPTLGIVIIVIKVLMTASARGRD
jgi:hypothetical protein